MLRHTALFLLREATTADERRAMLQGLARLFDECPTVLGGDFGESLLPSSYDVALHLDFADLDGYRAYAAHSTHKAVSGFNATLSVNGSTARVDWLHDGLHACPVRHCATLFQSDAETPPDAGLLAAEPGVISARTAPNIGHDPRASDWILDVELEDEASARALLESDAYRTVLAAADPGRTAAVTHLTLRPESSPERRSP